MNSLALPRQTAAGFLLAACSLAAGVYFATRLAAEPSGHFLLLVFYALAGLALLKAVLVWGAARGYPIRRADGRLHLAHLLRNLLMAALAIPLLLILSAPLAMLAFSLAR